MSPRRQMLLAAAAAMLVTFLFVIFLIRPKLAEIAETREAIASEERREDELRAQLARLEDARRNAPLTAARLLQIAQYLPSSPELPSFIRQAQQAATLAGVDLESIAPSPPAAVPGATGIDSINVTLVVEGGYFRIEDFLARLENLDRVVLVNALSLSPETDDLTSQVVLRSTLTMQMFVVLPDARLGAGTGGPAPGPTPSPTPTPTGSP